MSRQEIKHYGKQEFRRFPLVTLEPLPDQKNLADYYHRGAKGELGSRIKNMEKPLICGKTAKTYKFWDNLLYHYKHLYPLYGRLLYVVMLYVHNMVFTRAHDWVEFVAV